MITDYASDRVFFDTLIQHIQPLHCDFIIVTHLLPNAPQFLEALNKVGMIRLIVAIPYSIDEKTKAEILQSYSIVFPSMDELTDSEFMVNLIKKAVPKERKFIIQEIGGYFAGITKELKTHYSDNFIGIVEDTEAGHKRYLSLKNQLACPVISIARSKVKAAEDFLIGDSCLRAAIYVMHQNRIDFINKKALVMGFGKIGRATAYAAKKYGFHVSVYDMDPIRSLIAFSEGFDVGERTELITQSDFIFGATANYSIDLNADKDLLKEGVILISCSSKCLEFNLKQFTAEKYVNNIEAFHIGSKKISVFAKGYPINFIGDFLIGPMIRITHAEILFALKRLFKILNHKGLATIKKQEKEFIAKSWLNHFTKS